MTKFNWKITIAIVFLILIIGFLSLIIFDFQLNSWKAKYGTARYNQGVIEGYNMALNQIYEKIDKCTSIPLVVNDETHTLISIECLIKMNGGEVDR